MKKENEDVRLYYRHSPINYKNERLSICGMFQQGILNVGISRCSNKDQFEKAKGRLVATGRAEKCPVYTINTTTPKKTFIESYKEIEIAFNNKSDREGFLKFINQNVQDKVKRNVQTWKDKIPNFLKNLF